MRISARVIMLCLTTATAPVYAQYVTHQIGQFSTIGKIATHHDYSLIRMNPAAAASGLPTTSTFDVNMFGPIGAGYEVGQIDSLVDELDALIDILEQEDLTAQEALDAKQRFDPFLQAAAVDGRLKAFGHFSVPLFPVYWRVAESSVVYTDFHLSGSVRSTVFDDDIDIVGFNDTFTINTDAAVYVKGSGLVSFSVGYAQSLWQTPDSTLYGGIKANLNRYSLSKNIISLAGLEDGENIGDAIKDDYENNANADTQVAIDIGLEWVTPEYTVGLTVNDLNEPEYRYGQLASDCSAVTGLSLDNCIVAQNLIAQGRLRANETYIANAQATLSGAYTFGESNGLVIGASVDLNEKNDPVGDQYQWAHVSATGFFESVWFPQLRVGYSQNLTGSELSYYSVGITFFKRASLDVTWSDEQVDIDGTSAPRSAVINFSVQSTF